MKKAISLLIVLAVFLSLCSCRMKSPEIVLNERVFEKDGFVRTNDSVSMEMLSPSYWTEHLDDDVIMTYAQISLFNEKNNRLVSSGKGENVSLKGIEDTIDGRIVSELINSINLPDYSDDAFINGSPVPASYWDDLYSEINIDSVKEKVKVRFGFSVQRASLRRMPTNDYCNDESDDYYYDGLVMSDLMPFAPVAVLHVSKGGNWMFVATYYCCGWIEKDRIAFCESRKDWLQRQKPDDFLVVTGKELRLNDDPYSPALSGQIIPMGTAMPLVRAEEAPESVKRRYTYASYIVKLPSRGKNGIITDEYFLVPYSSDVSVGYLPYTSRNVIELAFKLLGDLYGWAGSYHANDCSGIVREIFRCFGFEFPRVAGQQIKVSGLRSTDMTEMSDSDKIRYLEKAPAGTLLYFSGHIMIYLGMDANQPYVISAVGSIATPDMKENEYEQINSIVVTSLLRTTRKTGVTWLTSLTGALIIDEES